MPLSHAAAPDHDSCSASSARLEEPLAGSAPVAPRWLAVEQPGPWGPRALTSSHFPPELGHELTRKAEAAGVRIALIRRPGQHAEHDPDAPRQVFFADTRLERTLLWSWATNDPYTLLDLDFDVPGKPLHEGGPLLLVCTNGKRDTCCAVAGRALANWLAADARTPAEDVWETDHLGGHRFAPTALLLPTGYVYGRLSDPVEGRELLRKAAAGKVVTRHCRGRSTWSRPGQAAELALREELQEFGPNLVSVVGESRLAGQEAATGGQAVHHYEVLLRVRNDGYRAVLSEAAAAEPRPESCGKAFGAPLELRLVSLDKLETLA
ncbi:sucrase ferredoxin [Actinospica robiniae]|uniref:sucrase ferredoxin n=1 Tax=Actinospica robiniae TaxID=304901 RepID=UPI000424FE67|nr:sucrase ferredoxin [Actinospica robiniae]